MSLSPSSPDDSLYTHTAYNTIFLLQVLPCMSSSSSTFNTGSSSMSKIKIPAPITLEYYALPHLNNTIINVGESVMIKEQVGKKSYLAKLMKIKIHGNGQVRVHVCRYYKPEETSWGKRSFHGAKELLSSDHTIIESVDEIEGKFIVHTLKDYMKLEPVAAEDYYCRFDYNITTHVITNNHSKPHNCEAVYCKCMYPYNPDQYMVRCDRCDDLFHPSCIDLTLEEAKLLDGYVCDECYNKKKKTNKCPADNTKEQEEIDLWNGVEVKY